VQVAQVGSLTKRLGPRDPMVARGAVRPGHAQHASLWLRDMNIGTGTGQAGHHAPGSRPHPAALPRIHHTPDQAVSSSIKV
jgi:hypothetical protein